MPITLSIQPGTLKRLQASFMIPLARELEKSYHYQLLAQNVEEDFNHTVLLLVGKMQLSALYLGSLTRLWIHW